MLKQRSSSRDEWIRTLQAYVAPSVESLVVDARDAQAIAAGRRKGGISDGRAAIRKALEAPDEELLAGIDARDAETCLHEAVREHAKVLSLASENPVKTSVEVPSLGAFYRLVAEDAYPYASSTKLRDAIRQAVVCRALQCVPASRFAASPPKPATVAVVAAVQQAAPKQEENEGGYVQPPPMQNSAEDGEEKEEDGE